MSRIATAETPGVSASGAPTPKAKQKSVSFSRAFSYEFAEEEPELSPEEIKNLPVKDTGPLAGVFERVGKLQTLGGTIIGALSPSSSRGRSSGEAGGEPKLDVTRLPEARKTKAEEAVHPVLAFCGCPLFCGYFCCLGFVKGVLAKEAYESQETLAAASGPPSPVVMIAPKSPVGGAT
ncbi:unnamed protein product [Amoebophrya sp. A120]|nr:unnamed protein product [Amoebophrya sp. A120]|eukprot:GSA120T00008982001.1